MDAADKDDNKRNIGKIKTMTQYKKNQPAYDAKFIDSNLRVFCLALVLVRLHESQK